MELDKLAPALVKFQSIVPVIPKNQIAKIPMKNGGSYSYKYADLADIWDAIRKPLADNGLAVTQFLVSDESGDYIKTKIWHESGQNDSEKFKLPTAGKTPQEVGSVVTYYKRYTLGAALGISTEEDDDGASGNKAPKEVITKRSDTTNTAEAFGEDDRLKKAKEDLNKELEDMGLTLPLQKKAFIVQAIGKSTIDTLDEAFSLADAIDNNK